MWEAPSAAPVRAERTGWGRLSDRCSSGSAGAHTDPLARAVTLAPPHPLGRATGPGRGGVGVADRPGRRSIYGPARVTWAWARPLLLWSAQGTRAGGPGREPAGGGGSSAQHPNMAREGERHSCGAARGGAPAGYIKPEREDQRPPQRTAPREASLPSRGDRGPSQRAAGVATRPGRAGVGEGTGTGEQ